MCGDEWYFLLKLDIAPLLELARKFWMSWSGQTLEKGRKVARLTTMFKVVSGLYQLYNFHPIYYLKGDRTLGNSTLRNWYKLVPKQTNTNTVLLHVQSETGTLYQTVSLKSSQWRLLNLNGRHVPSLKTLTQELFLYLTLAPWLYLNITTCTFAHLPWWDIYTLCRLND